MSVSWGSALRTLTTSIAIWPNSTVSVGYSSSTKSRTSPVVGEFLRFRGVIIPDLARLTTANQADLQRHLRDYLLRGGIPDPLKYPDLGLHQALYNDILYRDIAARYRIGELGALKELAFYLASNPASLISFNKLKEHLRLGSVNTVKNYLDHLAASWLFFTVNVHDYAVKRQQIAPKRCMVLIRVCYKQWGLRFHRTPANC